MEQSWVVVASLFAGVIDSIVGGGGLVLVPALFATYPAAAPATLLGTNKSAAIWGTSIASLQYARKVTLRWKALLPAAGCALAGAFAGAWVLTKVDPSFLRKLLPAILVCVLLYTLANRRLGREHVPRFSGRREIAVIGLIGVSVGFYDGFFGPGTGSFFIFLLVRVLGYDFLNASASAKVLNVATNFAALILFGLKGYIWWKLGLMMAVANVIGSLIGTGLALKHGTSFVRGVFLLVVVALICKTAMDAF